MTLTKDMIFFKEFRYFLIISVEKSIENRQINYFGIKVADNLVLV